MTTRHLPCSRPWSLGFGLLSLILFSSQATQLPAQISHTGQSPRQHVVLTREPAIPHGCGLQESEFFRIFPDGTKAPAPFRVPDGQLLVITDVDWWLADFKSPPSPGYSLYFELALEHQVLPLITTYRVFRDAATTDPQNRLGRSVAMTTGFVVAPGTRICPFAQVPEIQDTDLLRLQVILRGYLIKDPKP
jgi:hypothetical protein